MLYKIRISKGLTQQNVADQIGITRQYYTMIEQGLRRPSAEVAKKIAKFFGFEKEWFKLLEK